MDRTALRGAYARLRGIRNLVLATGGYHLVESVGRDYDSVVAQLGKITEEDMSHYKLSPSAYQRSGAGLPMVIREEIRNKLEQITSYVEYVYQVNENILELGSIYNSIRDEELKSRCSDLLSAPSNFDRVINQATQVLETRIRFMTKDQEGLNGSPLVNRYIKADPSQSVLELSSDRGEQEGYANLFRGMMGAFRNPSHHKFLEYIDREHALQICAFIDNLLIVLADAKVDLSRR